MAQSTADTTGLKWAPDTGPNSRMSTPSPNTVVTEFCSSSSPVLPGESCWAAMPEPMTTATSRPVPRNSASSRRANGATAGCGRCCRWSRRSLLVLRVRHGVHGGGEAGDAVGELVDDGFEPGRVKRGGVVGGDGVGDRPVHPGPENRGAGGCCEFFVGAVADGDDQVGEVEDVVHVARWRGREGEVAAAGDGDC